MNYGTYPYIMYFFTIVFLMLIHSCIKLIYRKKFSLLLKDRWTGLLNIRYLQNILSRTGWLISVSVTQTLLKIGNNKTKEGIKINDWRN